MRWDVTDLFSGAISSNAPTNALHLLNFLSSEVPMNSGIPHTKKYSVYSVQCVHAATSKGNTGMALQMLNTH